MQKIILNLKKYFRFTYFSTLLVVVYSCKTFSNESALREVVVGKVFSTIGSVTLDGKKVSKDDVIKFGDMIKTEQKSQISLILFPGFSFSVGSDSQLKIVGTMVKKNSNLVFAETAISLLKGRIKARLDKSELKQEVQIFTKRSISAVRGTEFEIIENEEETTLDVDHGIVDFKTGQELTNLTVENGMAFTKTNNDIKEVKNKIPTEQYFAILPAQNEVIAAWKNEQSLFFELQNKNTMLIASTIKKSVREYSEAVKQNARKVIEFNKKQGVKTNEWLKKNIKSQ